MVIMKTTTNKTVKVMNITLLRTGNMDSCDCTIDDTTITCDGKEYKYKMQGNNLILSYDNVTRNFIPSNLYSFARVTILLITILLLL